MTDAAPIRPHKFVAVIDDTPECALAVRFAARRASLTPADRVALIHVTPPLDFVQWGGVQEMMEAEAHENALATLEGHAHEVSELSGHMPELIVKIGKTESEILEAIRADTGVYALVLATSAKGDPGPLVSYFASNASALPCILVVVPGSLHPEDIDTLVR
ncbi:MAG: universal stress protein [Sphingomonadales bacterium]|nr:MAG: universal stress protein [Sphingomonadales bacterium]